MVSAELAALTMDVILAAIELGSVEMSIVTPTASSFRVKVTPGRASLMVFEALTMWYSPAVPGATTTSASCPVTWMSRVPTTAGSRPSP